MNMEALKYVWEGSIPLQIHIHESEVTTVPAPPPALILAPRIGYLPLLASRIKPYFSGTLPPGVDTIWFEYNGLPLKWYIPTGVLFDLLCAQPERPWNLTVHFRGYPGNILIPCEGEDSVKWSFINSLKEASYIISGNCKNVMNMSQPDQEELWRSVLNGNLDGYLRVSSKLKLGIIGDQHIAASHLNSLKSWQSIGETDTTGQVKTGRVPVRLYVWCVGEDFDDFEDAPHIDAWEKISYINQPVEIQGEGTLSYLEHPSSRSKCFTLGDALKFLLPEYFRENSLIDEESSEAKGENEQKGSSEDAGGNVRDKDGEGLCENENSFQSVEAEIKLVRIQGIEPKLEIPFSWVVSNLINPEHFLHICVCVKVPQLTPYAM
ncbi:autophagy protein 5 isoform X1 [Ziziphus jujuba]|uniref:Autophagy protein 5 n=1 Tax=Ziziphus jujuba TaxID=326968 RepID=A0ABM3II34_ZIZJJ|nr:autophagy protein 5 isoform X1 [Ziziphus jujuba]